MANFLQLVVNDVVVATVGERLAGPANHFAVWVGDGKNSDGTEATPYVVIFAAGSKFGLPFDDHAAAWCKAVAQAHQIAAAAAG